MIDHVLISPRRVRIRVLVVGIVALLMASLLPGPAAEAQVGRQVCLQRNNNTYQKLLECVTLEGVRRHQARFQRIADNNDGNRASGTAGYDRSANYVARQLRNAGYQVTRQEFDFPFFEELAPAELERVEPEAATFETATFEYSGSGDVTAPVQAVDLNLEDLPGSTSGCEPEDFADFEAGNIALIRRGACTFAQKALNAQNAGAVGVIIFNTGIPGAEDVFAGTLGDESAGVITIPVVGASFADGVTLSEEGTTARVFAETFFEVRTTENVIADSPRGDANNVVMAGAHLDSVVEGPGINDNGSGSAGLLETALMMAKVRPVNKLRFAFWGAEESGLVGSTYYVNNLPTFQRNNIALYQNYDMIGSPNYVFMVYDADESTFAAEDFGVVVPEGSIAIEDLYEQFYTWRGAPYDDTGFSGRSDYDAFIDNDIPSGGLFTGAEVVKTEEQVEIWGGTAGEQFDPCYHEACDTFENNDDAALALNSDAVAFSMLTYAYSTEAVNGVPGRRVPGRRIPLPEPAGPEGTFAEGDDGGGDHPHGSN
jgi:Zn-dependent M28 family amino/carboxypeptidase